MYKTYLIEFSKLYKRLMEVECCMKKKLVSILSEAYSEKCYLKLQKFFVQDCQPQNKYKNFKPNFYQIALDEKLTNREKLEKSINSLYLLDFLSILTKQPIFYKDKRLVNAFYGYKPAMNELRFYCSGLSSLRNYLSHFNYRDYERNRKKSLNSLKYFEILMNCTMGSIHKIPKLVKKPPIKDILEILYLYDKSLFKNDRLLCDLYDDLAVLNGHNYNELPAFWSILRQKYEFERQKLVKKQKKLIKKGFDSLNQIPLPLEE